MESLTGGDTCHYSSEHYRTGRTVSGQALLCDRTGAVYHADSEDAGGDESGERNPEY